MCEFRRQKNIFFKSFVTIFQTFFFSDFLTLKFTIETKARIANMKGISLFLYSGFAQWFHFQPLFFNLQRKR